MPHADVNTGDARDQYSSRHDGHLAMPHSAAREPWMLHAVGTQFDAGASSYLTAHLQASGALVDLDGRPSHDGMEVDYPSLDQKHPGPPSDPTPVKRKSWRQSLSGSIQRMVHRP